MFITHEANRSAIGQMFGSPAETYWTVAELALPRIWFVVTFLQQDPPGCNDALSATRTMFVSTIEDMGGIGELCKQPGFELDAAYVVSPGYKNGSDGWKFERIVAVWSANDESAPGGTVAIIETELGTRYSDGLHETPVREFRDLKLRMALPSRTLVHA